jgi:O-antigen ligase
MQSIEIQSPSVPSLARVPLGTWLLYLFTVAYPFFMFTVFFTRDSIPFWITILIILFVGVRIISLQGSFWLDRSFVYLLLFLAAYVIGTLVIDLSDLPYSWLGRTPLERSVTTTLRLLYVVTAYFAFVSLLTGAEERVFANILKIQLYGGALFALFGILQYVSVDFFHSSALTGFEPTNETYVIRSNIMRIGTERVFRASSIFSEPAWFGFFLTPLVVKCFVAWFKGFIVGNRIVHLSLMIVFAVAVLANFSLTALLGTAAVVVVAIIRLAQKSPRKTILLVLVTAAALAALLVSPLGPPLLARFARIIEFRDASTIDRLVRAYTAVKVVLLYPWFGVGPGGFAFFYPRLGGLDWAVMATPLNIWLSVLTDVGIVGFVPLLLFLVNILRRASRVGRFHPLVSVYLWSILTFLILLSTLDNWFGEMLWFELAILVTLTIRVGSKRQAVASKGA